jgi:hypothetical protein
LPEKDKRRAHRTEETEQGLKGMERKDKALSKRGKASLDHSWNTLK